MKYTWILLLVASAAFAQFTPITTNPPANAITAKGGLLTNNGSSLVEFLACANGESIEWDSAETLGFKCVAPAAPVSSGDPTEFFETVTMPANKQWSSVAYGNGVYVAVARTADTVAAYSLDGFHWKTMSMPTAAGYVSVDYGNGMFLAVGNTGTGRMAMSTDGVNWTNIAKGRSYSSVSFIGGTFYIGFTDGAGGIETTTDGVTFNDAILYGDITDFATDGAGTILAAGGLGDGSKSTDNGVTWTPYTTPSGRYGTIAYGNGVWVLVNNIAPGGMLYSTDAGDSWTVGSTISTSYALAYGAGSFVALASNAASRWKSTDGGQNAFSSANLVSGDYRNVKYINGRFWAFPHFTSTGVTLSVSLFKE